MPSGLPTVAVSGKTVGDGVTAAVAPETDSDAGDGAGDDVDVDAIPPGALREKNRGEDTY